MAFQTISVGGANIRGAGEPIFEHDFTGEDMIKVFSGERYGKERLVMV